MNLEHDIATNEGMPMARIRKGHSVTTNGLTFVYDGDHVDVIHKGKQIDSFSVVDDGINRVGTEYDLQYEAAWYLKDNNVI